MSGVATAVIGGAVVGSVISSNGQRDAAERQSDAINNASGISQRAAEQARQDALDLYAPALSDYTSGIRASIDQLVSGQATTAQILQQSTANANDLLSQGSMAAQSALLGIPYNPIQYQRQGYTPATNPYAGGQGYGEAAQQGQTRPYRGGVSDPSLAGNLEKTKATAGGAGKTSPMGLVGQTVGAMGNAVSQGVNAAIENPDPLYSSGVNTIGAQPLAPVNIGGAPVVPVANGQGLAGLATARSDVQNATNAALEALGVKGGAGGGLSVRVGGGGGYNMSKINSMLRGGEERGLAEFQRGANDAAAELEQYASTGEAALKRQAAMSGALGAEAQAQAYDEFVESPGTEILARAARAGTFAELGGHWGTWRRKRQNSIARAGRGDCFNLRSADH